MAEISGVAMLFTHLIQQVDAGNPVIRDFVLLT
jgi:hypothetical protein